MKTKIVLLTLALGVSACILPAQDSNQPSEGERPPRRQGGGPGGPGGQRPANPIFLALDLNNDGAIDADEMAKASASLKKLDKNGDGKLTPDEFRPKRAGGKGGEGRPPRPSSDQ